MKGQIIFLVLIVLLLSGCIDVTNDNEIVCIKTYEFSNESKMIIQLFAKRNTKMFIEV